MPQKTFWQRIPRPFFALAPMEGITDYPLREMMTKVGKPDVLFTEFTNVAALASAGLEKTLPRLNFSPSQRPIVAQLWGSNPEQFYQAALLVRRLKFDGVDINFGCPDKSVVGQLGGGALIREPALAAEIVAAVRKGCGSLGLSVKTRLGFDQPSPEWISHLVNLPIDALTIHSRTVRQKFSGKADWKQLGLIAKSARRVRPDIVIIGNGDITGYQDGLDLCRRHNTDGVMIGRALLTNPWLFDRPHQAYSLQDRLGLLQQHLKVYNKWGEGKNFAELKKFIKMYLSGFPNAKQLRQKLMACTSPDEFETILKKIEARSNRSRKTISLAKNHS